MKVMKKLLNIATIFLILQLFTMIFANSALHVDAFVDNVLNSGKAWSEMGEDDSNEVVKNANSIFGAATEIYNTIRVIGAGIFMVVIAVTIIAVNLKSSTAEFLAEHKVSLIFLVVLALLFIFAEPILGAVQKFFQDLESTL